jgi:internalin A
MRLPLSENDKNFEIINFDFSKPNFILKFKNFVPSGLINQLICLFGVHPDDKKRFWRDQLIFTFNQEYKVWIQLNFSNLEIAVYIHKKEGIEEPYLPLPDLEKLIFMNIVDLYNCKEIKYDRDNDNKLTIKGYEWENERAEIDQNRDSIKEYIQRKQIDTPKDLYISVDGTHFLQHRIIEEMTVNQNTVSVYLKNDETKEIGEQNPKTYPITYYKHFTNNEKVKKMGKKIFISYSRKDVDYKDELKKHLNMLKIFDIADNWSCEEILIEKWHDKIQKELQESDLIVYMLSANFFNSNYILEHEVKKGMEQVAANKNKKILCVIVSDFLGLDTIKGNVTSDLEFITNLSDWQYLPYGKTENNVTGNSEEKIIPLKRYPHIEMAYAQITEKILDLLSK